MIHKDSRYYNCMVRRFVHENGNSYSYISPRLIPRLGEKERSMQKKVIMTSGDRLDNISWKYLGDPEQFWRICDSNDILHPLELPDSMDDSIFLPGLYRRNM